MRAKFLTCGEPQFPNAKMWSLAALSEAATYETLVTSDADARVSRTTFGAACREMVDPTRELASCLYIGRTTGGFAAQLDAVGKSVEMSGGIFVADMIEGGTRFALGVSMILRREHVSKSRRIAWTWGSITPRTLCWGSGSAKGLRRADGELRGAADGVAAGFGVARSATSCAG